MIGWLAILGPVGKQCAAPRVGDHIQSKVINLTYTTSSSFTSQSGAIMPCCNCSCCSDFLSHGEYPPRCNISLLKSKAHDNQCICLGQDLIALQHIYVWGHRGTKWYLLISFFHDMRFILLHVNV